MASLSKRECWVIGGLAVAAVFLFGAGAKKSPGGSIKVPSASVESFPPFTPPPAAPVLGVDDMTSGFGFTPHRYPPACGNEISVVMHRGLSVMALPAEGDTLWLSNPPSEGEL